MANPPAPNPAPTAGETNVGSITLSYGIDSVSVTGIIVDSYKRDAKFNNVEEITNNVGVVTGVRMSDYRIDMSVSGRMLASTANTNFVGGTITFAGDTGTITDISLSGEAKGFAKLDIKAVAVKGISSHTIV